MYLLQAAIRTHNVTSANALIPIQQTHLSAAMRDAMFADQVLHPFVATMLRAVPQDISTILGSRFAVTHFYGLTLRIASAHNNDILNSLIRYDIIILWGNVETVGTIEQRGRTSRGPRTVRL